MEKRVKNSMESLRQEVSGLGQDLYGLEEKVRQLERVEKGFNKMARWFGYDDPEQLLSLLDDPVDPRSLP